MIYIHTDGVEYSDDKKTLVRGPKEATEITILDSVTSIWELAFWRCSGLTSIVIPDSVTSIGEWAFFGCSGLKEIRIPKGTRDKFCAMPELKKYENLLVEYKKEEKEKCATPESE